MGQKQAARESLQEKLRRYVRRSTVGLTRALSQNARSSRAAVLERSAQRTRRLHQQYGNSSVLVACLHAALVRGERLRSSSMCHGDECIRAPFDEAPSQGALGNRFDQREEPVLSAPAPLAAQRRLLPYPYNPSAP